jgi:molybdopterin-containing oxidoreductase family membrane subunit
MFESAFRGGARYWLLLAFWGLIILLGLWEYSGQLTQGLTVTGMSRDITWGLYIAQFTFLVGVAASAVMVVLPYYLHNYKAFGKITILGEFLAVSAVAMCMLFIFVDLGQPLRVLNVMLHPTPNSVMFWDMVALGGYLILNLIIAWVSLDSERNGVAPPKWIRPLIYLSIPWAVSIHTVTAFLYCGLPGRHLWLTAIMAPRFLASAFSAGPALLIILCLIVRRRTSFDPGKEAIGKLATIVLYAMIINVFFIALEFFTAFYSQIPGHMHGLEYLYFGLEGHSALTPWMWTSVLLAFLGIFMLLSPAVRQREDLLGLACGAIFLGTWIDKGMGLVVGGFIPSPLGAVNDYTPTGPEVMITLGVYGVGFLILTVLYKMALSVRRQLAM